MLRRLCSTLSTSVPSTSKTTPLNIARSSMRFVRIRYRRRASSSEGLIGLSLSRLSMQPARSVPQELDQLNVDYRAEVDGHRYGHPAETDRAEWLEHRGGAGAPGRGNPHRPCVAGGGDAFSAGG